ncbi:MAG: DUF5668 domain-containing protein [Paludibacter sp.]|nr:DUF5668 domain-containing protein [Paludibacter sp.]
MNNEIKNSYRRGYSKGLGFGLFLMAVGLLFLGFNFGVLPQQLRHVIFSWPMLLVFFGIVNLFKRHLFSGATLTVIGAFFLFPRIIAAYPEYFPGLNGGFTQVYWPLLLIAAGVILILSKLFGRSWGFVDFSEKYHEHHHYHYRERYSKNGFSKNSVFGSGEHIVLDPVFKGGELNAVFGGITLDLRKTTLAEGDTILEINAVFGGVTIIVGEGWNVETHLDTVFGGFEDKRIKADNVDTSRKLIITGACVFGGGELRD